MGPRVAPGRLPLCSDTRPLPPLAGGGKETFTSSFSFIQQSLRSAETPASQEPEPPPPQPKPPAQLLPSGEDPPPGQSFWQRCPWDARGVPPHPPDCDSVDTEVTSSQSVDSDNASASSVTSGYDSATPASDQGWDSLLRKHQVVLQDCLHNNRTFTKIESMMLKLRRLQQKAILDDDYDADAAEQRDALPGPLHRRDKLIQKRKLVEVKKVNCTPRAPRGWRTCLVRGSVRSVSSAGGDRRAAAEVGRADGPQPVSAAADPAGGASG
ncbi:unnamed protein product [Tetraodon nigroviridis]|uniref:(spotted green pufferfish) hypothetical protein n=1 Tax=Tetraodon nigroviridis TaxID=99883 RepID=Q4RPX7_TETNG|nr:unnamed protein product [Tetraodon nigroviridis]